MRGSSEAMRVYSLPRLVASTYSRFSASLLRIATLVASTHRFCSASTHRFYLTVSLDTSLLSYRLTAFMAFPHRLTACLCFPSSLLPFIASQLPLIASLLP
jgi:hypothetical protein